MIDPYALLDSLFFSDGIEVYKKILGEINADWIQNPDKWHKLFTKAASNAQTLLDKADENEAQAFRRVEELRAGQAEEGEIIRAKAQWYDSYWDGERASRLLEDMQHYLEETEKIFKQRNN